MEALTEDELMSPPATAEYLGGVALQTLANWRCSTSAQTGPPFIRINDRMVRYRKSDVDAWLDERRVA